MLGRPRYISETRASPSDSLKCLTLGLGRTTGMPAWEQREERSAVDLLSPVPGGSDAMAVKRHALKQTGATNPPRAVANASERAAGVGEKEHEDRQATLHVLTAER
jgi:hypothetical protein